MRLLFWSELFRPHLGGVEVWSAQLIHALQARGHDCLAIASHGPTAQPDETVFEGLPVRRFSFHSALLSGDLGAIRRVQQAVAAAKRAFRPDLIHLNTSQPSLFFHERTTAAYPCRTLLTVHEPPLDSARENSLLGRTLTAVDRVVCVSHAMQNDVLCLASAVRDKCSVVHNAYLAPSPIDEVPSRRSLLCVGRIVREKGFDLAIEALAKLPQDVRLDIVGDGPARAELESLAARCGVSNRVTFAGWREPHEVDELMQRAGIVVVPSRWREPFGLIALQGAAAARPVVAFATGGLAEIVVHGETGLLVDLERGSAGLADAIASLLCDPERGDAMGRAARERQRREFDYDCFVSRYEALYRQIVSTHAGAAPVSRESPT
jgi:glycogen(starch) synthase